MLMQKRNGMMTGMFIPSLGFGFQEKLLDVLAIVYLKGITTAASNGCQVLDLQTLHTSQLTFPD